MHKDNPFVIDIFKTEIIDYDTDEDEGMAFFIEFMNEGKDMSNSFLSFDNGDFKEYFK